MYPIFAILTVAILRQDKNIYQYVLPLSIIGTGIAFYHYLLQLGVIAEKFAPCTAGVSCTVVYGNWFGFITIPLLSLVSFVIITISMFVLKSSKNI